MKQFFQQLRGRIDEAVSSCFRLQSWGDTGNPERERWTFYVDQGRTIGIVGIDGKIHTMMGYHAVTHYYEGDTLVRRVPVRKDLKPGERLATHEEIVRHQREITELFSRQSGFSF